MTAKPVSVHGVKDVGGVTPLIPNLGSRMRYIVSSPHLPCKHLWYEYRVSIYPEPVWTFRARSKYLALVGNRTEISRTSFS